MFFKNKLYEKNILRDVLPYVGWDTLCYNAKCDLVILDNVTRYFQLRSYRVMEKIIRYFVSVFHDECLRHSCIEVLEYYRCRNYPINSVDEVLPFLLSNSKMLKYIQRCGVYIENAYILRGKLWYKRKPDFIGYSYTNW